MKNGFASRRLFLAGSAVELSIGLGVYAFPAGVAAPAWPPLQPFFPLLSTILITGGIVLLLICRYSPPLQVQRMLLLIPAAPLAVLAGHGAAGGSIGSTVGFGTLAAALLAAPWLASSELPGGPARDLLVPVLGLMAAALALVALAPVPDMRSILLRTVALRRAVALSGLVSATALLWPGGDLWRTPWGLFRRALGAVLPLLLVTRYVAVPAWTSAVVWAPWPVSLLWPADPVWLRRFVRRDALPLRTDAELAERSLETWTWFLVLAGATLTVLPGAIVVQNRTTVNLFVLAVTGYAALVYWMLPGLGTPVRRLHLHLLFITVALGFLVADDHLTGNGFLALLAVMPVLAFRYLGTATGRRIFVVATAVVLLGDLNGWQHEGMQLAAGLGQAMAEVTVLLAVVMGVAPDAIGRRRVEAELRESEERFAKAFVAGPMPMTITTFPEGRYVDVNTSFLRTTGYRREEVVGRLAPDVGIWANPEDRDAVLDVLRREGAVHEYEYPYRSRTGDVRVAMLSMELAELRGRRCALSVLVDITERRQAEDQIRRLNMELEKGVTERTQELAAANKELEAFAYSVSHDLRAPLRSIDGFSKVLVDRYGDQLDPTARDYLNRVRRGSQRLGQLMDDLLNLSRVTRWEMHRQRVDLSALARSIAVDLQQSQPARQVEFAIPDGLTAQGDARLLEIALRNLLDNAWKFTAQQPSPRIEFGHEGSDGQGEFFVRDNGAGFDMAYADKLFTPFQRLHPTAEFPGSGIGLATVQRIISRHGGRVRVQAAVNQGATFYFSLQTREAERGESSLHPAGGRQPR